MKQLVGAIFLLASVLVLSPFPTASSESSRTSHRPESDNPNRGSQTLDSKSAPPVESVLSRYIEALGGKEAINKIHGRRLRGKLTHLYPGQNPPQVVLPAEVIAAAPEKEGGQGSGIKLTSP
jgi:hypothetical protein